MRKIYTFRSDHGAGVHQFSLELNEDHMPICFDTFMDWVYAHIQPQYRWMGWRLIEEKQVK